ncbi:MAG: hypothetical protein MI757_00080 [Pirellulales bacterium]|nr:hypothetical protein [Pirellulales bacterium]
MSSHNRLVWNVPAALVGRSFVVLVSVRDSSGQELFHKSNPRVDGRRQSELELEAIWQRV